MKSSPLWNILAVSFVGTSRGLKSIWGCHQTYFHAYNIFVAILLIGHIRCIRLRIHILNIYLPCQDRATFWDLIQNYNMLKIIGLILE